MDLKTLCFAVVLLGLTAATPAPSNKPSFWKGTILDGNVEEMRSLCAADDPLACLKLKAVNFLDNLFQRDNFQVSEFVEVNKNGYQPNEITSRSEKSLTNTIEKYVKSHDVTFKYPMVGSKVTVNARNLDDDEVSFKLRFDSGNQVEGRKSKLKKILLPILTFVVLKAITVVPLMLGILGLQAWNALKLSFFSFIISVALAVFQLCKKIAADHAHPQIAAQVPWDSAAHYAARSFDVEGSTADDAQQLAYSAYVQ